MTHHHFRDLIIAHKQIIAFATSLEFIATYLNNKLMADKYQDIIKTSRHKIRSLRRTHYKKR